MNSVARAAEHAARASYGRLVALLAARTRDVAAAEDALAEAFASALAAWPRTGIPANPEAWLLTTARRAHGHTTRHAQVRANAGSALRQLAEAMPESRPIPDERLTLLFVCAHPAIDPAIHTPLMLQTILGLNAERIAAAFLVAPAAMSQRLVRAKSKIRDAAIRFARPDPADLQARLPPVLDAIYAAYTTAWEDSANTTLAEEALFLARLLADLLPDEPESLGLLALIAHSHARHSARRSPEGAFVPLRAQNRALWSRPLIAEAEAALHRALPHNRPGRYQLEAAIQSAHTHQAPWPAIATLHEALIRISPTTGARTSHAAALAESGNPEAALTLLDAIAGGDTYQPWWATRAHALSLLGLDASAAYERAASLATDPAVRAFLLEKAGGKQSLF